MTSGEPAVSGLLGGGGTSIEASVGNMLNAANSGGFAISENAGKQLLDAIGNMRDAMDNFQNSLHHIDQEPQLGTSPGATVTKPFVRQVANGDNQSFIPVLKQFGDSLDQAAEAITKAIANYHGNESTQTGKLNQLGA